VDVLRLGDIATVGDAAGRIVVRQPMAAGVSAD
jgi:hypothetical protein